MNSGFGKRKLRRAVQEALKNKQDKEIPLSGVLGIAINGRIQVEVPNRNGYVWVRIKDSNEVIQAINSLVSPVYDLPVLLRRDIVDPSTYTVIDRNMARYKDWGNSNFMANHAAQHTRTPNVPGGDPIWVYNTQFMPFLAHPELPSGTARLLVEGSPYNFNGNMRYAGVTGTINLVPELNPPGTGSYVHLFYLDQPTGNFGIVTGTTQYAAGITATSSIIGLLPDNPDPFNYMPIAGLRFTSGTTLIDWANIYQLTPFSGGGLSTGTSSVSFASLAESQAGVITDKAVNPYGLPLRIVNNALIRNDSYGGNARGDFAVDLQRYRTNAIQVAAGKYSVICGGETNQLDGNYGAIGGGGSNKITPASSYYGVIGGGSANRITSAVYGSILGGNINRIYGDGAVAGGGVYNKVWSPYGINLGGYGNRVSGSHSSILAGSHNWTGGAYSSVIGKQAISSLRGEFSQSSGQISSIGDAQKSELVARVQTTDNTPTLLTLAGDLIVLPDNTTWAFSILVVARRTDTDNEGAGYQFYGVIDRNAGAASTALIGSVSKTVIAEDTAAWDINVTANSTAGSLDIIVTGEIAKTINWVAVVKIAQVKG